MSVGKVSTKDNVSDLGTKRLSRDRMEYLMFLCKVDNMSDSSLIGSSVAERLDEQQAMKAGVKMFKQLGLNVSNSKGLIKILLLNALSVSVAMDSTMVSPSHAPGDSHGLLKLFFAFLCTFAMYGDWFLGDYREVWCRTSTTPAHLQGRCEL